MIRFFAIKRFVLIGENSVSLSNGLFIADASIKSESNDSKIKSPYEISILGSNEKFVL
ncbi:hypothetical protein [Leptospira santarosai]|uniref:Uncharacterized protein n=1 Tax=Leptospira santarosai serovar Arenal str. MAVJ 401 TaxID=1049976 RepID=M6JKY4_9LEPT|nr:hypothetical protein [Leptospira santarosai]EMN20313.1 hypothetical protein LEP1GSC063_2495 [Leptospira santarosai serovar Arenal str. MAVJ 401]